MSTVLQWILILGLVASVPYAYLLTAPGKPAHPRTLAGNRQRCWALQPNLHGFYALDNPALVDHIRRVGVVLCNAHTAHIPKA